MNEIKVAIVEDVTEIRESLRMIINGSSGFRCKDVYSSAEDALNDLPSREADVVIMDIHLPGISGVECVKELRPQLPNTQFVMYTVYDDDTHLFEALANGANGYMLKSTQPAQILENIKEVMAGGSPMSSEIARRLVKVFQADTKQNKDADMLSDREKEILLLMQKGFTYREIAGKLFISMHTVKTHIHNIYEKLQVKNRAEAVNKVFK